RKVFLSQACSSGLGPTIVMEAGSSPRLTRAWLGSGGTLSVRPREGLLRAPGLSGCPLPTDRTTNFFHHWNAPWVRACGNTYCPLSRLLEAKYVFFELRPLVVLSFGSYEITSEPFNGPPIAPNCAALSAHPPARLNAPAARAVAGRTHLKWVWQNGCP